MNHNAKNTRGQIIVKPDKTQNDEQRLNHEAICSIEIIDQAPTKD